MRVETTHFPPLAGTEHQFGYQWNIYREILPLYEEQFYRWVGNLSPAFFRGKRVLDAGCGIGRNMYWALKAGAGTALAFDNDARTVDVARKNLSAFPNCEVRQKSIYDLDLQEEFDVAFSIGVVHHLARPKLAVTRLVQALKPGGTLILWVYGKEGNERFLKYVEPMRRWTSRIPLAMTRRLSTLLTIMLRAYLVFPHKSPYLKLLGQMSFRHQENIVFDQLLPTIANYWTRAEVEDLVATLPVKNVRLIHTNKMSWTLIAEKI